MEKSYFNINNLDKNIESNQSLKTEGRVKEERTSELESPATSLKISLKKQEVNFLVLSHLFLIFLVVYLQIPIKKNE